MHAPKRRECPTLQRVHLMSLLSHSRQPQAWQGACSMSSPLLSLTPRLNVSILFNCPVAVGSFHSAMCYFVKQTACGSPSPANPLDHWSWHFCSCWAGLNSNAVHSGSSSHIKLQAFTSAVCSSKRLLFTSLIVSNLLSLYRTPPAVDALYLKPSVQHTQSPDSGKKLKKSVLQ